MTPMRALILALASLALFGAVVLVAILADSFVLGLVLAVVVGVPAGAFLARLGADAPDET